MVTAKEVKAYKLIRQSANYPLSANDNWNIQKYGITESKYRKMRLWLISKNIDPQALHEFDDYKWLRKVNIKSFSNMTEV